MPDRSRPFDPIKVWLCETGTIVRAADADVQRLYENLASGWLGKLNRLNGEIGRQVVGSGLNPLTTV
jgi:hypothetical protein